MNRAAFVIALYPPASQAERAAIHQLLLEMGWEERFIAGQLEAVDSLAHEAGRDAARERGVVFIARAANADAVIGYISVQFHEWNALAQIHGLIVHPAWRRQGVAAALVMQVETWVKQRGGRGIYVDTPVSNYGARHFYEAQGYEQDYIMTEYYDDGMDGVTYRKRIAQSNGHGAAG